MAHSWLEVGEPRISEYENRPLIGQSFEPTDILKKYLQFHCLLIGKSTKRKRTPIQKIERIT